MARIATTVAAGGRVLVTTLTKKMAEDLTDYLADAGVRVQYLHSDIDTITRIEILRELRLGTIDVLVGINLLREGLDLPEVALVAILDADKEGFLRSASSLIQTMGRAARNVDGMVVLYADTITDSMREAVSVTQRRREVQIAYNREHGIDPQTIRKSVTDILERLRGSGDGGTSRAGRSRAEVRKNAAAGCRRGHRAAAGADAAGRRAMRPRRPRRVELMTQLEAEMKAAAAELRYEEAALLRDEIAELRSLRPGLSRRRLESGSMPTHRPAPRGRWSATPRPSAPGTPTPTPPSSHPTPSRSTPTRARPTRVATRSAPSCNAPSTRCESMTFEIGEMHPVADKAAITLPHHGFGSPAGRPCTSGASRSSRSPTTDSSRPSTPIGAKRT